MSNADENNTPTAEDAQAVAQAGAEAAAAAPEGTSRAELKKLIREAVKEEADERGLTQFGEKEAGMVAAATITHLEQRGAFNPPAEEPVNPPANEGANPAEGQGNNPGSDPSEDEEPPRKRTFAERFNSKR